MLCMLKGDEYCSWKSGTRAGGHAQPNKFRCHCVCNATELTVSAVSAVSVVFLGTLGTLGMLGLLGLLGLTMLAV